MIEIKCKAENFKLVPIEQIVPNPKNNNRHSIEQINAIAKLIKAHGFREPLTISNRSGFLNCGHARLEAATNLGMTEVPVIYQDFASEAEEYQHMTADNEIARWAELDFQGVYDALKEIPDIDTSLLGIEDFKLPEIVEPQADEDEIPEAKPEPKVVRGEVYILGNHRLMCGDSTSITDVDRLMNGEKANMVFTDPPYGMFLDADYSSMTSKFKGSNGGNRYDDVKGDHADFTPDLINTVFASFPDCEEVFLWGADYYSEILPDKNEGSWVVWDKRGDESADKMFGSTFELCWSKSRHKREIARVKWAGIFGMEKEHDKKRCHPTQKPVELVKWFFDRWGNSSDVVADLYGGSGSTLIGCEKTGRKSRVMELDPVYCGVILDRWQKFTGKKAHREDGVAWDEIKEQVQ